MLGSLLSRAPDAYGTPLRELYDLRTDAGETNNLSETDAATADAMEAELESWIAAGLARTGREQDPLIAQGITLGRRWEAWRRRGEGATG